MSADVPDEAGFYYCRERGYSLPNIIVRLSGKAPVLKATGWRYEDSADPGSLIDLNHSQIEEIIEWFPMLPIKNSVTRDGSTKTFKAYTQS